jgi:hypothetical protein
VKCKAVKINPEGHYAIICGRPSTQAAICDSCKRKPGTKLCDFPVSRVLPKGKTRANMSAEEFLKFTTCSRALCDGCSEREGDKDYCGPHHRMLKANPGGTNYAHP